MPGRNSISDDLTRRFGQAIREARLAAGLTQTHLAMATGISRRTIQRIEEGAREPKLGQAAMLAAVLDLNLDAAVGRIIAKGQQPAGPLNARTIWALLEEHDIRADAIHEIPLIPGKFVVWIGGEGHPVYSPAHVRLLLDS